MSLPRAIQKQVDDADAFVAQMNGQPANTDTDPPDPNPQPPTPENPPQNISPEPQPKPAPTEETWERKYNILQGKYDAEVPRLHSQLRELNTQVQQLIADNAVLKVQKPEPTEPVKTLITEQDKEAFGPDLLDLIDRATEQKVAGYRDSEAQLKAEIAELKGKLGNVTDRQVVSDKDRFLTALGQQVPDWEALNTDQGFLNWLAEVDPVYGLPRQVALNNAYEVLDATRTANIFRQYKALTAPAQTQQTKPNLQSQVAPTRSRTSPAPANSAENKRIFSQQEITQFYEEWRRGYLDNDEAVRMEKEIHAAIGEGRVR